jgi:hypothetical protein
MKYIFFITPICLIFQFTSSFFGMSLINTSTNLYAFTDTGTIYINEQSPNDPRGGNQLTAPITNLDQKSFSGLVDTFVVRLGEMSVRLLIALSLLTFLWGLMKYIYKGQESDQARVQGRDLMLWGIIGLFVMTSVWGLVSLLTGVLGVENIGTPQFPSNS